MKNYTRRLDPLLLNGKLEVFPGVDTSPHVLFRRTPISDDRIYLVISDLLFKAHYPDSYEECLTAFSGGADLSLFQDIPFVQGHNFSTTTYAVNQFLLKHDIRLHIPISVSSFDILLELCRSGKYATMAPGFHLHQLIHRKKLLPDEIKMHIFPVKGLDQTLSVEQITHRDAHTPRHTAVFLKMMKDYLRREELQIQKYLDTKVLFQ